MPKITGDKGKPIAGIDAIRDNNSGAVLYHNSLAYQKAVKLKRARKSINNQDHIIKAQKKELAASNRKINKLEKQVNEIMKFIGTKPNGKRDIN